MSTKQQEEIAELKGELEAFKIALLNAKAIEQTYLKFGPIFDEIFEKIDRLSKKVTQMDAQVTNHQNMIVKALQEKYRGGTS